MKSFRMMFCLALLLSASTQRASQAEAWDTAILCDLWSGYDDYYGESVGKTYQPLNKLPTTFVVADLGAVRLAMGAKPAAGTPHLSFQLTWKDNQGRTHRYGGMVRQLMDDVRRPNWRQEVLVQDALTLNGHRVSEFAINCHLTYDADHDGIFNEDDACPEVSGPASNEGCPPWPPTTN